MRILITGGCGFLGSNLAKEAMSRSHEVAILDNLARVGGEANLEWLKTQGKFYFHKADVRDADATQSIVADFRPEVVFHVAGQVAMTTSIQNPRMDFETN